MQLVYVLFQSTPSAWRETSSPFGSLPFLVHNFNPLPPHGGRLCVNPSPVQEVTISIHSLRMEGDVSELPVKPVRIAFQSTPSAWRETIEIDLLSGQEVISIHSLRMEGDPTGRKLRGLWENFNPLPPHGGRPAFPLFCPQQKSHFNPLPPHGGRLFQLRKKRSDKIFQSTPSAWRETR